MNFGQPNPQLAVLNYRSLAPEYDTACTRISSIREETIALLGLRRGDRVLDVASGTGLSSHIFAQRSETTVTSPVLSSRQTCANWPDNGYKPQDGRTCRWLKATRWQLTRPPCPTLNMMRFSFTTPTMCCDSRTRCAGYSRSVNPGRALQLPVLSRHLGGLRPSRLWRCGAAGAI